MHSYFAYGVSIRSDFRIPEFLAWHSDSKPAVEIRRHTDHGRAKADQPYMNLRSRWAEFWLPDVGLFQIRFGCRIDVYPKTTADDDLVRLYLMGTAMALLLAQRRRLVLHASSIRIGGRVVAFLGDSGAGKSTLAAALHFRGHSLIADDITAVQLNRGKASAFPTFPWLKLMPEAAAMAGAGTRNLALLHQSEEKRGCHAARNFSPQPFGLDAIYVLTRTPGILVERLTPHNAFLQLICHTYPTRLNQVSDRGHFLQCGQLATSVPMFWLRNHGSQLADLADLIENHAS